MTGKKTKNIYRKKRKGKAFSGIQRHAKRLKEASVTSEIDDATPGTSRDSSAESDTDQPISGSRWKMSLPDSDASSDGSKESNFQEQGYRLIDLNKFSSTLSSAHVCKEGEIKLHILTVTSLHVVDFSPYLRLCTKCFNCVIQFFFD